MKYREILKSLSENIFQQDRPISFNDISFITSETQSHIQIYRRNLFGLLIKSFSEDFPATLRCLGENNFYFLVRSFLLEKKIDEINIHNLSQKFCDFLKEKEEIHQDELLEYIAKLDLFWSQQEYDLENGLVLPVGIAQLWGRLLEDEDCHDLIIDLDRTQKICLRNNNGESELVILSGDVCDK